MQYITIIFYTLGAWLVHVGLVALYLPRFTDTKSLVLRMTHALEIFLVMLVAFSIYFRLVQNRPAVGAIILTVLGTLSAIDLVLFAASSSLRGKFDLIHVATAFSCVALAITVASARTT